jgi:hypothetical protein
MQCNPLVASTILLAGLQTMPSLYGSKLHLTLYHHAQRLLNNTLLQTPLPLDIHLSFMLFARWNLVPQISGDTYIDSWLLSGVALMHGMLAFKGDDEPLSEDDEPVTHDPPYRIDRIWRMLYLTHLQ